MYPFSRILVPVDGSDTATKALVLALQLARDNGGCVRLLHHLDEMTYITGYEYSAQLVQQARDAGTDLLAHAAAEAAAAGVPAETTLRDIPGQRLGEVVANEARAWEADLIVIGSHGRRGFQRVLMGSGAEQITRGAPVPVLIVPALAHLHPAAPVAHEAAVA